MHIRNSLPDEVVVQRIDERLSALGNCIACNDYVALIHPDVDKVRAAAGWAWMCQALLAHGRALCGLACSHAAAELRGAAHAAVHLQQVAAPLQLNSLRPPPARPRPPCLPPFRRRLRRLLRTCWAWRCSARPLPATCWWAATASLQTRGAWWRRRCGAAGAGLDGRVGWQAPSHATDTLAASPAVPCTAALCTLACHARCTSTGGLAEDSNTLGHRPRRARPPERKLMAFEHLRE